MELPQVALAHFTSLQSAAAALAEYGVAIRFHQFDADAFGNCVVILGTDDKQARFDWDGQRSILVVSFPSDDLPGEWVEDTRISVRDRAVFEEIGRRCASHFGILA